MLFNEVLYLLILCNSFSYGSISQKMGDNPPKKKLATGTSGQLPYLGNSSNTNNASNTLPLKKQDYEKIGRAAFKLVAQEPQTDQEQRKRTRPDELPVINITSQEKAQIYNNSSSNSSSSSGKNLEQELRFLILNRGARENANERRGFNHEFLARNVSAEQSQTLISLTTNPHLIPVSFGLRSEHERLGKINNWRQPSLTALSNSTGIAINSVRRQLKLNSNEVAPKPIGRPSMFTDKHLKSFDTNAKSQSILGLSRESIIGQLTQVKKEAGDDGNMFSSVSKMSSKTESKYIKIVSTKVSAGKASKKSDQSELSVDGYPPPNTKCSLGASGCTCKYAAIEPLVSWKQCPICEIWYCPKKVCGTLLTNHRKSCTRNDDA